MPVYDRVFPKAWFSHVQITETLARQFPPERLAILYARGLSQPHAQNFLVQSVLSNKKAYGVEGRLLPGGRPDWILWVEHDTVPPPNAFDLLRQHADPETRPVMHGLSCDKKPPYAPSIWRAKPDGKGIEPIFDWQPNTLYRVAHSGTCISLFHTSVFDKLKRPWYRMRPFEPGHGGMIPCISLTQRMHEAGVPIWAFTGCIAKHLGDEIEYEPTPRQAIP